MFTYLKYNLVWILFWALTSSLFVFFLVHPAINWGGDIIEYYGTTESLLNHLSPDLTYQDQQNIGKVLNPVYFKDPQYYIEGYAGNRYPVHFIFYSILLIPLRLLLEFFHQPGIKSLALSNLLILTIAVWLILKKISLSNFQKVILLLVIYLSPFVYFIAWPGPDLFYLSLLLLSCFLFYKKNYYRSALLTVVASWQSQPLIILACGFTGIYVLNNWNKKKGIKIFFAISLLIILSSIPYIYNIWAFRVLSPWILFKNIWTQYYGFGLHNLNFDKFAEQLFDINMGIFWYIPILFLVGMYRIFKNAVRNINTFIICLFLILTALFYQTNPAWNYGTSGYGPTRHILFLLPFLILFFITNIARRMKDLLVIIFFALFQIYVLSFNGFLVPDFLHVLDHSPYAKYILDNFPQLYNPTPEIFIDRTNHTDLDHPTSAIYKQNGNCKKAYILDGESDRLLSECGYIPDAYKDNILTKLQKHQDDLYSGEYVTY